jgi:hypothetical protein
MSKYGFSVDNIVDAVVVDREPGVGGGGGGGGGGWGGASFMEN